MLISLLSFFIPVESLGNDSATFYKVPCALLFLGQIAKHVNLKFIGALGTKY